MKKKKNENEKGTFAWMINRFSFQRTVKDEIKINIFNVTKINKLTFGSVISRFIYSSGNNN